MHNTQDDMLFRMTRFLELFLLEFFFGSSYISFLGLAKLFVKNIGLVTVGVKFIFWGLL